MISSRSNQPFPYLQSSKALLSDVRKDLAKLIDDKTLFGEKVFECWINELAPSAEGSSNIWDECLDQVRLCDLLFVLYNGDAGWAKAGGEIGICHAELLEAVNTAPAKVRVIQLTPLAKRRKGDDGPRDDAFREYVAAQYAFTGQPCKTGEEVIALVRSTLREAVGTMVRLGKREARKGRYDTGDALNWSRLDFRARRRAMVAVVQKALVERGASRLKDQPAAVSLPIRGSNVILLCSAISGPYGYLEAREGVNQLFLRDHDYAFLFDTQTCGPVHLIACQRSATESQAIRQLGFPDATVVSPPFGVYIADNVQKIQLVFLSNCRDPTSTAYQVQRFFDWLDQVGEGPMLVERAARRARIIQAIARELEFIAKPS